MQSERISSLKTKDISLTMNKQDREKANLVFEDLTRKLDAGGLSKDLINIVNNKTDAILNSSDNQCLLEELPDLIEKLEIKMKDAAKELNFEEAANLRDRIKKLRQKLARNN